MIHSMILKAISWSKKFVSWFRNWTDAWFFKWNNIWFNKRFDERFNKRLNAWFNEWLAEQFNKWFDERFDRWLNPWFNEQFDERFSALFDERCDERYDGWFDEFQFHRYYLWQWSEYYSLSKKTTTKTFFLRYDICIKTLCATFTCHISRIFWHSYA